jgi:hypothetical protein
MKEVKLGERDTRETVPGERRQHFGIGERASIREEGFGGEIVD